MPEEGGASESTWNVLLVEDDETVRRQVKDYLDGEMFASQKLNISDIPDLSKALNLIREHKADLVILDVYQGAARLGGEKIGVDVLGSIKRSGFVPVVLYTALPEGLEEYENSFVRLVGKEAGGLEKLKQEIDDLFRLRIPQLHSAIVNHLDQTLCSYMWGFVQENWGEFSRIVEKPEFLRLVVQRLAITFVRQGIEEMTARVYGTPPPGGAADSYDVHPAEYYIKPPIEKDPLLGDIRVREESGKSIYTVVLWPSCDMVSTGGRTPKTDNVLCARATQASDMPEVAQWVQSSSATKKEKVEKLIKNNRDTSYGAPDRFHFLPGVWDIPDLVVDFQILEHPSLATVRGFRCLATLASPFAEALGARFRRYIGRPGTPDLNLDTVLEQFRRRPGGASGGSSATR
jgi:CheY-like chemotaxis protein